MRNLLAFLAATILTFAGVGWYLDWYRLGTRPAPDGHRSVTLDIDTSKIGADLSKVNDEIQRKIAEKNREGAGQAGAGQASPVTSPAPTPAPAPAPTRAETRPEPRGGPRNNGVAPKVFETLDELDRFLERR